jgi:transcriptional regulator with XRE-family HTH domain
MEVEILTWQARTKKGITLVQLAKLTGISKSTLNNIENSKTSPTLMELEVIAKALGVRITDLFDSDYK